MYLLSFNHFNAFTFAIQGWNHTGAMRFFKRDEEAAQQGFNRIVAVMSQLAQFIILSEQVSILEEINKATYLPTVVQVISYLAIPLIGGACYFLDSIHHYPKLKKAIKLLHANMGLVFRIASLVVSIAFLHMGYIAYTGFSLAILAIDILAHKKILPLQVRRVYLSAQPWISMANSLLSRSWVLKVFSAIDIVSKIKDMWRKPSTPYDQVKHDSCLRNYQQFEDILNGKVRLEVNRDHVGIIPFPQTKLRNFGSLIKLCNDFGWSNPSTLQALETGLKKDARWQDFIESDLVQKQLKENKSDVQIRYLKTKFQMLVNSIENETIETGEPLDYGILKSYLGYIAEHLPLASSKLQEQIMISLAVEGGDYCGPGIYNQLEIAATTLMYAGTKASGEGKKGLPLKQRILLILQQERMRIVQAYHLLGPKINPAYNFFNGGQGDIHAFNYTIHVIGRDFGLPDQGSNQDKIAIVTDLERLVYRIFLGFSSNDLWRDASFSYVTNRENRKEDCLGYTPKRVLEAFKTQMGNPLISKEGIYSWAQCWINNVEVKSEIREAFLEKLIDGESFERYLKFKDGFINTMLVDMGILRISH